MKIIDDLLKVSNNYIVGVETSKEYKTLVKKLKEGNKAIAERDAVLDALKKEISVKNDLIDSNKALRERLEVYWKRLDSEAQDRLRFCVRIAELEEVLNNVHTCSPNLIADNKHMRQILGAVLTEQKVD